MAGELSKRQISVAKKDAVAAIDMYKADTRERLKEFKNVSSLVASAHRAYTDAGLQNEKKPSAKAEKKMARAYESYTYAVDNYRKALDKLNATEALIEKEYQKLVELSRMQGNLKAADRTGAEFEVYRESYLAKLKASDKSGGLADALGLEVGENIEELSSPEALPEPSESAPAPIPLAPKSVSTTVTSVNVAPVTIDVTPIVEKAISSAIDKLSEGLNRKLEDYVNTLVLPKITPEALPATSVIDTDAAIGEQEVAALEGILVEENSILEKLKVLCQTAGELIVQLGELSCECMSITEKQKELAELQKQINDIQRHTIREQQGVGVNQRLVSEEQVELIAAQTLVLENQKELIERQNKVAEAQSAAQKAEGEITAAIEELTLNNTEILRKHEELKSIAVKQNNVLGELAECNRVILAEQKAALSASKKLIKDAQKSTEKPVGAKGKKPSAPKEEGAPASDKA